MPSLGCALATGRKRSPRFIRSCLVSLVVVAAAGAAEAAPLDPAQQQALRAATFEVVYAKPTRDSLSYDKPLPLELIPFAERNDKYYSVGTAFAIGANRYVSAAHVIMAGVGSQYDPPALRDASGHVYEIEQMLRFSLHEDFAVFSLKNDPRVPPLAVNTHPTVNEAVYAVGNALGEGIVIRDGLYTSATPEEQDGRWKWIRFSAAASPGNSGGPLLDSKGRVIGVVLRKSPNENLNYAVSIAQVVGSKPVASFDLRYSMRLAIMQASDTMTLKGEFPLPRSFGDFDDSLIRLLDQRSDENRRTYLAKHRERTFPNGNGSKQLLNSLYFAEFPHLMQEQTDGTWDAFHPEDRPQADLGHNGYVAAGQMTGIGFAELRRPDDIAAATFYGDSKVFMDLMLKGIGLMRRVGSEAVKVTSLGKAATESIHEDSRGRKWQIRTWLIEYNDSAVVTAALAVPSGYVVMYNTVATKSVHATEELYRLLTEFSYVSYSATLAQWREFLASTTLHPAILSTIAIDFTYDKSFSYKSKRCSVDVAADLQKITATSGLTLKFSYFDEGGKVVWDVASIALSDDVNGDRWFTLLRNQLPPASLPDSFRSAWEKIVGRRHPYNAVPYKGDGRTVIESVIGTPSDSAAFQYTMSYYVAGEKDDESMKAMLALLEKGTSILEH